MPQQPIANAVVGNLQWLIIDRGAPDAVFVYVGQDPGILAVGPDSFALRRKLNSKLALVGLHINTTRTDSDGSPGPGRLETDRWLRPKSQAQPRFVSDEND